MSFKFVTFILVISIVTVLVSGGPGYIKKKFAEKCGTDEACFAAAEKCMGGKGKRSYNKDDKDDEKPRTNKLEAFNQCLEENSLGNSTINEGDCVDDCGEGRRRGGRKHHHGKCKKEIFDLLKSLEEDVAGPIRCCFSKAVGMEKVNSDGSINVEEFRTHLQERITDQTILDIYETAITTCLPQGANCNIYGFKMCTFDECMKQAQTQN
ncbi:UNVERIFIED_CONTAM: hypothetical protein RMT77_001453 [Armadillidium vulgare]